MKSDPIMSVLDLAVANAVIGIDTIWGGDVLNPSGTGRFIADSWFSDLPLPRAYTDPTALQVRATGGLSAKVFDRPALEAYLEPSGVCGAIQEIRDQSKRLGRLRRAYLEGVALCIETMWDLALELLDKGDPVPYHRCVHASTGHTPTPSAPAAKTNRLQELLDRAGIAVNNHHGLVPAVDAWRQERLVPAKSIPALSSAFIAELEQKTQINLLPHLPRFLGKVPRANIRFLPIRDAWFSGSMNYLGRARKADGSPEYEATYEINASLQISIPEFLQLVSHEVVPGHVTTFAYLQNLYIRQRVGFEASIQTMNTRGAALSEGIANNAILIAYGVQDVDQLPDEDIQIGLLLALLQDDAKNQASFLTWKEGLPQPDVAEILRQEYLVSEERAQKLSGAWGRHPLLGRMYLPAYRAGTELVSELRRKYPSGRVLPALYGCRGLADVTTIEEIIAS